MRKIFIFLFLIFCYLSAKVPDYQELLDMQEIKNSFPQDILYKTTSYRPDYLPTTYISKEGNFKIHYTIEGTHAVSTTSSNEDNVPDWVYITAEVAEHAFHVLVDSLGFDNPPIDGVDGDEFDIYIKNMGGSDYALTYPENQVSSTSRPNDWTSFLLVDNDYIESAYYTNGVNALKVTVAHEFFHTIQLGYNYDTSNYLSRMSSGDRFFFEWSSTWFEDYSYPEVNDYVNYAKNYSYYPDDAIWSSTYWYSHGIFMKFLIDNYSIKILTKTWDKIKNNKRAYYALEETIKEETNTTLPEIYNEYCRKMYYSGSKYNEELAVSSDAQYFPNLRINWGDRYEYDNFLEVETDVYQLATLPIEVAFNSVQHFGLLENDNFRQTFIGSYIFDDNNSIQNGILDLSSDFYINKSGNGDTLLLFITNKNEESSESLTFTVDFVEPVNLISIGNLFPNPIDGNGKINLKITGMNPGSQIQLTIYNLVGEKVTSEAITLVSEFIRLDLGSVGKPLASGIYFIKIKTDDNETIRKFTIIK